MAEAAGSAPDKASLLPRHPTNISLYRLEDVPADPPREIQGQPHRKFPGEGIAPLRRIIEKLKEKKYAGAVSFETFAPDVQSMDPYQVAMRVRAAIEPLIK